MIASHPDGRIVRRLARGAGAFSLREHQTMPRKIIDLSLTIEDNMPAHKLFQRPIYTVHMSHELSLIHI